MLEYAYPAGPQTRQWKDLLIKVKSKYEKNADFLLGQKMDALSQAA